MLVLHALGKLYNEVEAKKHGKPFLFLIVLAQLTVFE